MEADHLTRDEELSLLEQYRTTHDRSAEDRLVRSQLGLVHKLASKHQLEGIDREDLIQEGALGLMQAIRRFDAARGVRLSSYAAWWIRAFQYRHIMQNCRLVRLGTSQAQRRIFFRIRGLRARLSAAGIEPTPERIASMLGVDVDTARSTAQRLDWRELSLDAPRSDDRETPAIIDLADDGLPPDELAIKRETARIVRQERDRFRRELTGRRRELFDARWLAEDAPSLQELATRFGVTRERTRQIEQRMLSQLGARLAHAV